MTKIITHYGKTIDLLNPDPDTICLEDIAHNLSHLCRFNGATKYRYSVAQHSLYVSNLVAPEHALPGLMHDAAEAFLGDVITPLKSLLPKYKEIETKMWIAICRALDMDAHVPWEVAIADSQAYLAERVALIGSPITEDPDIGNFKGMVIPEVMIYEDQKPNDVKHAFLTRFHVLKGRSVL